MLDIGWMEFLVIGVVALIVVGPKDLPVMFRTAGQFMGKARGMAREFQRSLEQAADDTGLKDSAKQIRALDRLNLNSATASARKFAEGVVKEPAAPAPAAQPTPEPAPEPAAPKDASGQAPS